MCILDIFIRSCTVWKYTKLIIKSDEKLNSTPEKERRKDKNRNTTISAVCVARWWRTALSWWRLLCCVWYWVCGTRSAPVTWSLSWRRRHAGLSTSRLHPVLETSRSSVSWYSVPDVDKSVYIQHEAWRQVCILLLGFFDIQYEMWTSLSTGPWYLTQSVDKSVYTQHEAWRQVGCSERREKTYRLHSTSDDAASCHTGTQGQHSIHCICLCFTYLFIYYSAPGNRAISFFVYFFVSNITRKRLDRFAWNFQGRL